MEKFLNILHSSVQNGKLIELKLINKKNKSLEYNKILIKPIKLKNRTQLSFVYRFPTKDITKNYNHTKSVLKIKEYLKSNFSQAIAFTTIGDYHFIVFPNGHSKIKSTKPSKLKNTDLSHNKIKKRLISPKGNIYLKALEVVSENDLIKAKMNAKFRQINKFVEIIDSFKSVFEKLDSITVVDMGSGKGYLSFALYDYLHNTLKKITNFSAVEMRTHLVERGNSIAQDAKFTGLNFVESTIENFEVKKTDLLIALHACDTATDDAIVKGVLSNAKLIICSPCCHKQIRKEINATVAIKPITRFGILKERQAEIVTDTIRALILEYYGYKTNIIEFISSEHTSKNLLITACKVEGEKNNPHSILQQISDLKNLFGIKTHYLESKLLNS